jgi:dihydrofolate reductase
MQLVGDVVDMRKLVLSMVQSVDGYVNGPGREPLIPEWSGDLDQWTFDMIERFDTLLYGRAAWQEMAAFWPNAEKSPDTPEPQRKLARFMNGSKKIVFSRTLQDAEAWVNSELANDSISNTVGGLRESPGKDIVIFAGAAFAQEAMRADLIDELWLLTVPLLFGHGIRLFEGHSLRSDLKLSEVRRMDTGAVSTRYIRTRAN